MTATTSKATATASKRDAALSYAARGWPVFPLHNVEVGSEGPRCSCGKADCDRPGKHPRTKHGLKDATTDADQIRRWWKNWPQANIAIATGKESNLFMVGPDGEAGVKALTELEAKNGALPRTPLARSGSIPPGAHHLFAWPADGDITNRRNHRGLPIDVRGDGGYFVAAPSDHVSGGAYAWIVPPDDAPLAPAPAWVLAGAARTASHRRHQQHREGACSG
jgi:hypothetical protein